MSEAANLSRTPNATPDHAMLWAIVTAGFMYGEDHVLVRLLRDVRESIRPPQPVATPTGETLEAVLHFDGSCDPNPGPSRCAFVLAIRGGRRIERTIELGQGTCNTSEYLGIILGMEAALAEGVTHLEVYGDSKLVIQGVRKMKPWAKGKPHLEVLKAKAQSLVRKFVKVDLNWIPREENAECDELSKKMTESPLLR